jgi:hypothetical protein
MCVFIYSSPHYLNFIECWNIAQMYCNCLPNTQIDGIIKFESYHITYNHYFPSKFHRKINSNWQKIHVSLCLEHCLLYILIMIHPSFILLHEVQVLKTPQKDRKNRTKNKRKNSGSDWECSSHPRNGGSSDLVLSNQNLSNK